KRARLPLVRGVLKEGHALALTVLEDTRFRPAGAPARLPGLLGFEPGQRGARRRRRAAAARGGGAGAGGVAAVHPRATGRAREEQGRAARTGSGRVSRWRR